MGPLSGLKIIELAGVGPGPMCAMLLADLGATVLRVERTQAADLGTPRPARFMLVHRSRRAIALDLKQPAAVELVLRLVESSHALIDPFRPGVIERLGLGPEACLARNPRLVIGRMTGWGQTGALAQRAGHDLNYIALSGVLHAIGREGQAPVPPLNLVGDYGGGALYLALGMLSALYETARSGRGQVVDAAMCEGSASLLTHVYGAHAAGSWDARRGHNVTDSGAPYYDSYACSDGKWLAVGAIEERFYREFLAGLDLDPAALPDRHDRSRWPVLRALIAGRIATRTRDAWAAVFEGTDACVSPVLDFDEAPRHPHALSRSSFVEVDGVVQPAPAPRFSRTPAGLPTPPVEAHHRDLPQALAGWLDASEIATWQQRGQLLARGNEEAAA
jgi:crotonobetainyl-CoA:carnitine CoA-transferase CaiB-like acyl-CoA transferase